MKTSKAAAMAMALACSSSAWAASSLPEYDASTNSTRDWTPFNVTIYNLSSAEIYRVDDPIGSDGKAKPGTCTNFTLSQDKHRFHAPDSVRAVGQTAIIDDPSGKQKELSCETDIKYCIRQLKGNPRPFPQMCFKLHIRTKASFFSPRGQRNYFNYYYFDLVPVYGELNEEALKLLGDSGRSARTTKPYSLEPSPTLINSRFSVTLQRYEKATIIVADVGTSYRCPLPFTPETTVNYTCVP